MKKTKKLLTLIMVILVLAGIGHFVSDEENGILIQSPEITSESNFEVH